MSITNIINNSYIFDHNNKDLIKNKGVVFTPLSICDNIISKISPSIDDIICEPSVGKGVFIFSLLQYFRERYSKEEIIYFFNNKLFCYDINQEFINEFKELLRSYFKELKYDNISYSNIICGDFLLQDNKYDIIIGNPPYVRIQNLDKNYLNKLKDNYSSLRYGNIDLYYVFIEKSLKDSKKIGFIIPNSFIKNKSGNELRNVLLGRVSYIYDFGVDMIWDNISTYTCILICDENTDSFTLEDKDNKRDLISWDIDNMGDNKLIDLVNYHSIGLATLRDSIYKNTSNIERGICKKYIKSTKSKSYDDYDWIIYPYNDDGNLISEDIIKNKYPNCYSYLLSNKKELLSRDNGKTDKYESWYSYGRKQGMLKEVEGIQVILPLTFLKTNKINIICVPDNKRVLVMSGISVFVKKELLSDFLNIINSDKFISYCENNNKIMKGKKGSNEKWITITSTTIKKFRY